MTNPFRKIIEVIRERMALVRYTMAHRQAMQEVAKVFGYSFPFHDLDKVIMYPFLGKRLTHAIHRRFSGHHMRNGDIRNKVEAALDWECAALTKPDKPLDAYDTWRKYYPDVDMAPTLKKLGMIPPNCR